MGDAKSDFESEGIKLYFTRCHQYLGGFCGGRE